MKTIRMVIAVQREDVMGAALALAGIENVVFIKPENGGKMQALEELQEVLNRGADRISALLDMLGLEVPETEPVDEVAPERDSDRVERLLEMCEPKIQAWDRKRKEMEVRNRSLRELADIAMKAGFLPVEFKEMDYLELKMGWAPAEEYSRMRLSSFRTPVVLIPLFEQGERLLVVGAAAGDRRFVLEQVLASVFYEPVEVGFDREGFTGVPHDPEALLERLEEDRRGLDQERDLLVRNWQPSLSTMLQRLRSDLTAVQLVARYGSPQQEMVLLRNRVPAGAVDQVKECVRQTTEKPHGVFSCNPGKDRV